MAATEKINGKWYARGTSTIKSEADKIAGVLRRQGLLVRVIKNPKVSPNPTHYTVWYTKK